MTTSPETLTLLAGAAELSAAGTPWADAATQLAVDPDELRSLAVEHSRDYDRLARRARTEFLRETLDAAIAALRALLKSPEPSVNLAAATTIVRYDMALMRNKSMRKEPRRPARSLRTSLDEFDANESRELNVSESTEVAVHQEVVAAKKVAQSPVPTNPAPVRQSPAPTADAARARERLVDAIARGRVAPIEKGRSKTLEVDRLIRNWLTD